MNYQLHNQDLRILVAEGSRPRHGRCPGWINVDWKPTPSGGNMVFLRQVSLPPECSVARTDLKIEAAPNLYEPAGRGQDGRELLHFYFNVFISPGVMLLDRRMGKWIRMPRLHGKDGDGFAFLCVHPQKVTRGTTVLDLIRILDVFFKNPGYKAGLGEAA